MAPVPRFRVTTRLQNLTYKTCRVSPSSGGGFPRSAVAAEGGDPAHAGVDRRRRNAGCRPGVGRQAVRPAPQRSPGPGTLDRPAFGGGLALSHRLARGVEALLLCGMGAARRSAPGRSARPPRLVGPPRRPQGAGRLASVGARATARPSLRIRSMAGPPRCVGCLVARRIRLRGVAEGVDRPHHRVAVEVPQPPTPASSRCPTPFGSSQRGFALSAEHGGDGAGALPFRR